MNTRLTLLAFVLLAGAVAFAAPTYESNLEKTFAARPGGKLVLDVDQGSVIVKTAETNQVVIRVLRQAKNTKSQAEADKLFANHEVTFQQDGDTVSVSAKQKKRESSVHWGPILATPPQLEVHYEISVPRQFDLELKTAGGDVRVPDLEGKLQARTTSGAIVLQHITGAVTADNAGGDILVELAGGGLAAHTTSGAIRAQKVGGKAELSNAGGDIELGEVAGAIEARTTSGAIRVKHGLGALEATDAGGDIAVETVEGDLNAKTTSGSIHIGQAQGKNSSLHDAGGDIAVRQAAGTVHAETTSGSIKLKAVNGNVFAHNAGGDILLESAGGSVTAETTSGSIRLGSVQGAVEARDAGGNIAVGEAGGKVTARTTSGSIHIKLARGKVDAVDHGGDIHVAEGRGSLQASTTSGNIEAALTVPPSEDCRLEVAGGGIKLTVPQSAALNLDARSSGGEVKSELPVTQTVQGKPRPGTLQGKLNGGGPTLYLHSTAGDIQLKAGRVVQKPVELEEPAK